jgi:M6 family metalloprotease-like protein
MQLGSITRAGVVALTATAAALAGTIVPGSASASSPSTSKSGDRLSAAEKKLDAKVGFPAGRIVQLLKQPDGSTFPARVVDLDQGGLFETTAGYGVERDSAGTWRYITGWKGSEPELGAVVTRGAAPAGLAKHLGRRDTTLSAGEVRVRAAIARSIQTTAEALAPEAEAAARAGTPRLFKVPALMLSTWYDEAKESGPTFHAGTDTTAYFKKLLNGFGGNPYGSVTQYYFEASFGQFLVQVDVYGTYTSAHSQGDPCYYGTPDSGEVSITDPVGRTLGLGGLGGLGMAQEAIPQAVDVPWADYDNDDDGVVDFTMMIHSGGGHEVTGDPCHTHSHQISVSSLANIATGPLGISAETLKVGLPTSGGKFVDRILTIPEYESADSPLTIGVAAHEMAHALGEPDYYDTSYSSVGTGDWDVMSGGSYLGNPSGSNPSMQSPATRVFQKYVTPTIVHGSLKGYTLKPRTALPFPGYTYGKPDPNLLLVPTYEISVGQTDKLGHEWTAEDVYGLAKDPKTGKYVVEGYYVENVSRNARSVKLDPRNPMGSMFDRQTHSGGLAVWHFDYWRQSTTYFGGANDAQSDSNRYQMDLEEFDQNDNTQELQLNFARGNAADLLTAAATGITSGTRMLPPGTSTVKGNPQAPIEISGATTPLTPAETPFTVKATPANESMTVTVTSDLAGDCKLQLIDPQGHAGTEVDSGSVGDAEELTVKLPKPGTWKAKVSDFALCGSWSGRVVFSGGSKSAFSTYGSADTWSNWSKAPTGWAFTNVRGWGNGLDQSNESGGSQNITLDVLDLKGRKDVSPGFITGKRNARGGTAGITAGQRNTLQVPVFSNGSKAPGKVQVVIRKGSATGAVVARRTVTLGAYQRKYVSFPYRPGVEGPATLVAVVDPGKRIREGSEANQVQAASLWVGPARPKVLVVDDDQVLSNQRAIEGALTAMGIRYAETSAHPSARQLSRYKAVIWSSGVDRYEGQLDKGDRAAIATYLSQGGRVLLTGNRVMDAITTVGSPQTPSTVPAWGAHWFGARTPEGNPSYIVSQTTSSTMLGRGLLNGLNVATHPSAARQFVGLAGLSAAGPGSASEGEAGKTIKPYGTASAIFSPAKNLLGAVTPESDKPFIGLKVVGDAAHGRFRSAVLGWNLGDDERSAQTVQVLRKVMRHFGVPTGKPLRPAKRIVYSTSVRDSVSGKAVTVTAVVLGGKNATPRLYFRRHALGKFYSVAMRAGAVPGTWVGTIPARAITSDGVDYYLRSGAARSPYTGGKRLWHSIAVALPRVAKPLPIKR